MFTGFKTVFISYNLFKSAAILNTLKMFKRFVAIVAIIL